jgi:hypothetical protein
MIPAGLGPTGIVQFGLPDAKSIAMTPPVPCSVTNTVPLSRAKAMWLGIDDAGRRCISWKVWAS